VSRPSSPLSFAKKKALQNPSGRISPGVFLFLWWFGSGGLPPFTWGLRPPYSSVHLRTFPYIHPVPPLGFSFWGWFGSGGLSPFTWGLRPPYSSVHLRTFPYIHPVPPPGFSSGYFSCSVKGKVTQPMEMPDGMSPSIVTSLSVSPFLAARSIPWDSIPRIFAGLRLATMTMVLPTISAGV